MPGQVSRASVCLLAITTRRSKLKTFIITLPLLKALMLKVCQFQLTGWLDFKKKHKWEPKQRPAHGPEQPEHCSAGNQNTHVEGIICYRFTTEQLTVDPIVLFRGNKSVTKNFHSKSALKPKSLLSLVPSFWPLKSKQSILAKNKTSLRLPKHKEKNTTEVLIKTSWLAVRNELWSV